MPIEVRGPRHLYEQQGQQPFAGYFGTNTYGLGQTAWQQPTLVPPITGGRPVNTTYFGRTGQPPGTQQTVYGPGTASADASGMQPFQPVPIVPPKGDVMNGDRPPAVGFPGLQGWVNNFDTGKVRLLPPGGAPAAPGAGGGGKPATGGKPQTKPTKPTTFQGSATGRTYNVGQQYKAGGYVYVAQPNGTFKKVGKDTGFKPAPRTDLSRGGNAVDRQQAKQSAHNQMMYGNVGSSLS